MLSPVKISQAYGYGSGYIYRATKTHPLEGVAGWMLVVRAGRVDQVRHPCLGAYAVGVLGGAYYSATASMLMRATPLTDRPTMTLRSTKLCLK